MIYQLNPVDARLFLEVCHNVTVTVIGEDKTRRGSSVKVEGYPPNWRDIRVIQRAPSPGFSEKPLNNDEEYELWHCEAETESYFCTLGKILSVGQGNPRDLYCNLEE
jgi:hypothetical protein